MKTLLALSLALLGACGVDAAKVPAHEAFAAHGATVERTGSLSFAVVGATVGFLPGVRGESPAAAELVQDIRAQASVRGLEFVVLTGGEVRRSTTAEWKGFGDRWGDVLLSGRASENKARKPVLAMPGASELAMDRRLRGFGAAFPDQMIDIGFGREASWGYFDAKVAGKTWRFLFVDSHRQAMGSRWKEQMFWLPSAVKSDAYDNLLVFMPDPRVTLAEGSTMDPDDGPSELLDVVEEHANVGALMGVFSGGPRTNEAYLPSGAFGEIYVVAGNGGIGGQDLNRWGAADDAGFKDVNLDVGLDLGLIGELDSWAADEGRIPEAVLDKAKARGSWEGFTGVLDGDAFPVQGWWQVDLKDDRMQVGFRVRHYDGTFRDVYKVRFDRSKGWQMQSAK
jgi:hypothetical protein